MQHLSKHDFCAMFSGRPPAWLLPFATGTALGFSVAAFIWRRQGKSQNGSKGQKPTAAPEASPKVASHLTTRSEPSSKPKARQFLPRGSLPQKTAEHWPNREVLCQDAIVWLEGQTGFEPGASVLTGIPDIHEVDSEGKMGLEGYVKWFQQAVKLILQNLPEDGRAIFMQTDVKVSQDNRHGRNAGGGSYWKWLNKAHLAIGAASEVSGTRLLWHKIICSGLGSTAGGRSGLSASYTHYLCFTTSTVPEALDGCSLPDVMRKGLSTWKSGSGAQSVELACAYLKARGCTQVIDPFCGEGAVLAIANVLGMASLGVEITKKRAKMASSLDGKLLLDADR